MSIQCAGVQRLRTQTFRPFENREGAGTPGSCGFLCAFCGQGFPPLDTEHAENWLRADKMPRWKPAALHLNLLRYACPFRARTECSAAGFQRGTCSHNKIRQELGNRGGVSSTPRMLETKLRLRWPRRFPARFYRRVARGPHNGMSDSSVNDYGRRFARECERLAGHEREDEIEGVRYDHVDVAAWRVIHVGSRAVGGCRRKFCLRHQFA